MHFEKSTEKYNRLFSDGAVKKNNGQHREIYIFFQNRERSLSCLYTWQLGSVLKNLDIQQSDRILTQKIVQFYLE